MARKRERSQLDSMDEINLTPMMDLVFLLLIVFIITTPLLENSIDVSPPIQSAEEITNPKAKVVNMQKDGTLYMDDVKILRANLEVEMRELHAQHPDYAMSLRADGALTYDEVIQVLGIISKAGFKNVNLITQSPQ